MATNDPLSLLRRIAEAIEKLAPLRGAMEPGHAVDAASLVDQRPAEDIDAFVWQADEGQLQPVAHVNRIELTLLQGIDRQAQVLLENTRRFALGLPANNALLWGARGTGKSSLVKAVHGRINGEMPHALTLVEVHREDLVTLPKLLGLLRTTSRRFILYCDDLSFDGLDNSYKSLKAVLEGGIEGRPGNVVFYATSNRRHLMPREMIENERSTAINPAEAVEEKVSLSDRFGLWLGFHAIDQATYLEIVTGYVRHHRLDVAADALERDALAWAAARGARSGRVAWQFIQNLAGRLGQPLS
jgi:Predicted ATPase (AAA+ superfamily)